MDDKARKAEELLEGAFGRARTVRHTAPSRRRARSGGIPGASRGADERSQANGRGFLELPQAERCRAGRVREIREGGSDRGLLDVLDGYDRALSTVPDELKGQPSVEGMWLVERKLRTVLDSEGLEPIDSLGTPFDPYLHQAVAYIDSDEPDGTVIEEHQKAYRLHDRVIRPALVTVAKKKE